MESFQRIIRGRLIGNNQIQEIRELIEKHRGHNRTFISRALCQQWQWVQPNGRFKDMACRELLVRLERDGEIELPVPQKLANNDKRGGDWVGYTQRSRMTGGEAFSSFRIQPVEYKEDPMEGVLGEYGKAQLKLMMSRGEQKFWNHLIQQYHYLGYRCMVGSSLKYLIYLKERVVGCIGWASGVWKLGLRDHYIGWDATGQQKGLGSIVNNVRFLILPWIKIRYLASHVLSVSAKKVKEDWEGHYQLRAYLLESFVDRERFRGTCYKAANWIYLGQTRGQSKRGLHFYFHGHPKDVYIYPLSPDFRERLREQ